MTPFELVGVIEDAGARVKGGRRAIIVEFTAPVVTILGVSYRGKYLGEDAGGARYGYTRRQCKTMRAAILRAAEDDLRAGA